jgi:hypothetical protein
MMYKMAIQVLLEQTENEEVLMVPGRSCREDVFWAGWSAFGSLLVNVYLFFFWRIGRCRDPGAMYARCL